MYIKKRFKEKLKKLLKKNISIYEIYSFFKNIKLKFFSGTNKQIFRNIYTKNKWGNAHSVSGSGSTIEQTKTILENIPFIISKYKIQSILDLPCGDFNWMKEYDLNHLTYIGGDVVPELINNNIKNYGNEKLTFQILDLVNDKLPYSDLIFCRDCLVHFSYDDIFKAIRNIKKSKFKFLLTTNFVERDSNFNIPTGSWRPINLCKPPFNFPEPMDTISENCTEGNNEYKDKALSIWAVTEIPY